MDLVTTSALTRHGYQQGASIIERTAEASSFHKNSDKLMVGVVWGLLVISLGLADMHNTLTWAFLFGSPIAGGYTVLALLLSGHFVTRCAAAISLMALTGLHIHQAAGASQAHFGVFVLLAFLVCYRD